MANQRHLLICIQLSLIILLIWETSSISPENTNETSNGSLEEDRLMSHLRKALPKHVPPFDMQDKKVRLKSTTQTRNKRSKR